MLAASRFSPNNGGRQWSGRRSGLLGLSNALRQFVAGGPLRVIGWQLGADAIELRTQPAQHRLVCALGRPAVEFAADAL